MSQENKEFYELLNELVNEQTFDLELTNGTVVKCKQLTTAQLKELIKAVVDSPLTQTNFNTISTEVFKKSVLLPSDYISNTLDRLLFLIETRIRSISSTMTVNTDEGNKVIDFIKVKNNLVESIKRNANLTIDQTLTENGIEVTVGIPTLDVEGQLIEEIYKDFVVNTDDPDDIRKMLGEAFINEIAKTFKQIKIQDKTLDLSTISFKSRIQTIETLPASLVQQVVKYLEDYKKIIDDALTFEGYTIPIDGSLFSLR